MSDPPTHIETQPRTTIRMSYEEYLALDDSVRAEWKDGEAIIFMPTKKYHQRIVQFLFLLLEQYVRALGLGAVGIAPLEVRLSSVGPSREPDLFFVATEELHRWTNDRLDGGPTMAIEVISTESIGRDRGDKFYEYQDAGVQEYWIIDPRPDNERADFYVLDGTGRYQPVLPDAAGIFRSTVLPGFMLRLEWLWQDPAPDPFSTLTEIARQSPAFAEALRASLKV